jgi:hypothetical protein
LGTQAIFFTEAISAGCRFRSGRRIDLDYAGTVAAAAKSGLSPILSLSFPRAAGITAKVVPLDDFMIEELLEWRTTPLRVD